MVFALKDKVDARDLDFVPADLVWLISVLDNPEYLEVFWKSE